MQSLSLYSSSEKSAAPDLGQEIARLEALLLERRSELVARQDELRDFRARYTRIIGSRLAELAEIERAIKEAERQALGLEDAADDDEAKADEVEDLTATNALPVKTSLRKLFWSVARMFHPDMAADEGEARRRHSIMAEASRAYKEGDIESLHTLLGDEELRSYCASAHGAEDEEEDLAARLLNLREELRTTEYGIKRIRQDGLYSLKLSVDEEAAHGRDALRAQAEQLDRQIAKARRRLEHLS